MHLSHFLPESLVTGIWPEQRAQHTGWMVQNTRLFELFSCPIAQLTVVNNSLTSVRRVFELVNNCWFWCFRFSESVNYLFLFCGKKSEEKNCQFSYFKYPKKVAVKESVKELVVIKAVICFFPIFENHGYI
jgi:hypothetical protein